MRRVDALLDSNVVVSIAEEEHLQHEVSVALFSTGKPQSFAVAAHSYAEAFSTLTRRNASANFRRTPKQASHALASVASATTLLGLTPAQTFEAIRDYAQRGGIGPRL